ncbi:MAG: phospholipase D family protein [Cyclobacteriaceae bacterium]
MYKFSRITSSCRFGLLVLTSLLIVSCTSDEERYPPITEDYCSQVTRHKFPGLSESLAPLPDSLNSKTGVYVLEEGDISMVYRAWLSEAAEKSIDIQYFIFSGDNIGLIAVDYLLRAAERGVKVRLLVDDIMVHADADQLLALDSHPNLSIKIYNPTTNIGKNLPEKLINLSTDFRGFNQRMHNKTFIVDDKVVITGGRNIADEYFDYDHEYNFRDRDVLLLGKSTQNVSSSFSDFWNDEISVPVSDIVDVTASEVDAESKIDYVHQYACDPSNFWPEVRENIIQAPIAFENLCTSGKLAWVDEVSFISDDPGKNDGKDGLIGGGLSTDSLIMLINNAQESIYIQSPYLVTTELSQGLFKQAIARGVDVHILTNSLLSTDNLEAFSGYKRERQTLLDIGVNIYEFRPDAAFRFKIMTGALQRELDYAPTFGLHAKSMMIDQKTAVIGTFNLDPRSANLNTECLAIIHDASIATDLFNTMKEEQKPENAWAVTDDFNPDSEASIGKRFQLWLRGVVPKSVL